jgi:hypothetical protein
MLGWARRLPASSYETYGHNAGRSFPVYSIVSNVITPRTASSQYGLAVGGLVRVGTIVTGTISGGHKLAVGEVVYLWPGEANFAAGAKVVTGVTSTTFIYTESGSAVASTATQTVVHDQTYLTGDRFWGASAYALSPDDTLNVALDTNASKTYALPVARKVKPSGGAIYAQSGFGILDVDNGNLDLSSAFGTATPDFFKDFALYMHARGKSHGTGSNKVVLWRYKRMGAEGNSVLVSYANPTAPSQGIVVIPSNGQYTKLAVRLPSGAARSGLSLTNSTRFTASVTNGTNANSVSVDTIRYIYSKPSIASGSLSRSSNVVTATTGSAHGFSAGDVVYLTSTDVNFPAGAKTVVSVPSGTSFTYNEAGSNASSSVTTSVSSASVDPDFSGLAVGDIVNISGSGAPADHVGAWRVSASSGSYFEVKRVAGAAAAITTPMSILSTANMVFYPINTSASKASDIVTAINADANCPVTAVAVENGGGSPGAGTIDTSTLDEYLNATANASGSTCVSTWPLTDGINYVQVSNLAASPCTITLKDAVSSDLTSNADFANEDLRLVPITAAGLARFLSSSAVSGFYASSQIAASSRSGKVQLASGTPGSAGCIQVTGGTANSASANVTGTGEVVDTTYSKVTVPTSQTTGLTGRAWCAIQASSVMPKTTSWTAIQIASTGGTDQWEVTLTGGAWTLKQSIYRSGSIDYTTAVRITKAGRFAAYTLSATYPLSGISEGDWVNITLSSADPANIGIKKVVRVSADNLTFWVENPAAVTETTNLDSTPGSFFFYTYDSAMPGDTLVIDTTAFGSANRGSFTILQQGSGSTKIIVSGKMTALTNTSIGANAPYVRLMEASPARLIKQISGICRSQESATYSNIVFNSAAGASRMSSVAGSSVQALDKLAFPTSAVNGADAYSHATGLIGEVTRVLYGDPANPSVYPGVVAAGANVNVAGPLVKRIQISLAIRIRTGATAEDIKDRVKSAVASAINKVELGKPVALGAIVAAAQNVDGVVAVTIISPTYSVGNDLISVQANEKPRVLDIAQDVVVSVVG